MSFDGPTRRDRRNRRPCVGTRLPCISEAKRRHLRKRWLQQEAQDSGGEGGPICFESEDDLLEFLLKATAAAEEAKGKKWLQKAIKRPGRCSGKNFGGPQCPKGSPQYNLAKRLKKGGDLYRDIHTRRGHKEGGRRAKKESVEITERWRGGKVERSAAGRRFGRDVVLITAEPLETYNVHERGDPQAIGRVQQVRDPRTLNIVSGGGWGAQVFDEDATVTIKTTFPTREDAIKGVLRYWQQKG